jgi:hypothetical protein
MHRIIFSRLFDHKEINGGCNSYASTLEDSSSAIRGKNYYEALMIKPKDDRVDKIIKLKIEL